MSQGNIRPIESPAFSPASAKYGRLLPPPLIGASNFDERALRDLGLSMIDRGDLKEIGNPDIPAAYTYFGQFVDHDLTLDLVSTFEAEIDSTATRNFRTAALELDSLYGQGPHDAPHLFDQAQPGCFRLGRVLQADRGDDLKFDLPRLEDGTPLLADRRNDENLLISQLTVAFLRLHNHWVGAASHQDWRTRHEAARQKLRWHYQWVVLKDYLRRIVGQSLVDDILLNGRRLYDPLDAAAEAFIPVEFSGAAFRFGHCQVRGRYQINRNLPKRFIPTFPALPMSDRYEVPEENDVRTSLRGGPVRQQDVVDWSLLVGNGIDVQFSNRIRPSLSDPLRGLPGEVLRDGSDNGVLSVRNLLRGARLRLPDGRAAAMFAAALISSSEIRVLEEPEIWAGFEHYRLDHVPLWFYVLREAEQPRGNGCRLAGLGARIVAETLIGVLQKDPYSILRGGSDFRPDPLLMRDGEFDLECLLRAAGMKFGA
ncbi:MAG: peroxidase [Gammaproteobacteria bacterium]|uniref:peroxidase family protein n=1 Tax=Nevskia sp. TaxID=1929292 RepID=UPI00403502AB|nr:peroxidase [Gammaproteobacteria bacterium]